MKHIYDRGDDVLCKAEFTNADGQYIDPDAVAVEITDPSGNVTTYTYGVDAEIERQAPGVYTVVVDADEVGTFYYRFYSTGRGKAAGRGGFHVRREE